MLQILVKLLHHYKYRDFSPLYNAVHLGDAGNDSLFSSSHQRLFFSSFSFKSLGQGISSVTNHGSKFYHSKMAQNLLFDYSGVCSSLLIP